MPKFQITLTAVAIVILGMFFANLTGCSTVPAGTPCAGHFMCFD